MCPKSAFLHIIAIFFLFESLNKYLTGGLTEGTPGTITPTSWHIIARYLGSFPSLHCLRRRHVLVTDKVGSRVISWVQPTSQDNIAVGDADAAVGVVGRGLESGWRVVPAKDVRHTQ